MSQKTVYEFLVYKNTISRWISTADKKGWGFILAKDEDEARFFLGQEYDWEDVTVLVRPFDG